MADDKSRKGTTEFQAALCFGQTIGETMFLDELLEGRADFSNEQGQRFLSRFAESQTKATMLLAREIDAMREERRA